MTLDEFKATWIGKQITFPGVPGIQCTGLVNQYNKDVIGAPPIPGNAKDYVNNPLSSFYQYHNNDLLYIPPRGAIAVWNSNMGGGNGHVAIVESATLMKFTSLDQNWRLQEGVTEYIHDYKNVSGFLIPRQFDALSQFNNLVEDLRGLTYKYPKIAI